MFDLNILCVGQSVPTTDIPKNTKIWINNTNSNYKARTKHYYQIAPLMNFIDGIWYELLCSEDEVGGTSICGHSTNNGTYPYWISSIAIKKDLEALTIKEEYFDSFKEILKYLIGKSPIHTILLLCRFQSNDTEIVCGTIGYGEFISLLSQKKIFTNVCYSISD